MGVVKGINGTLFPARGRDEGQKIALKTRWGIYPAVIVRQDNDHPYNEIWKIAAKNLPEKYFGQGNALFVSRNFIENFSKLSPICDAGSCEGAFVSVVFDCDERNKCEGLVVTDRNGLVVILITTGPHEGRYVEGGECEYKIKP